METLSPPSTLPAGHDPEEAALVAALRRGDGAAYEWLVRAHGGRMLTVARRFLNNEEDARDAVQDTFLSAYKGIDRFDGHARLGTWLHRIVVNVALTRLRARGRKPEISLDDLLPRFLDDGHQAEPAAPWAAPLDALQKQEARDLVRRRIEELPADFRNVILLRDIEELDTEETARALNLSIPAVKTRLHRARQALRTLLDPHFRGGPA